MNTLETLKAFSNNICEKSIVDPWHCQEIPPENFEYFISVDLSTFPFKLVNFCFMYFEAMLYTTLELFYVLNGLTLYHYQHPSFATATPLNFISSLSIRIAIPAYFRLWLHSSFHNFMFRFSVSLYLSFVFCSHHIILGFSLVCYLSLLIMAFSPFTLNVPINVFVLTLPFCSFIFVPIIFSLHSLFLPSLRSINKGLRFQFLLTVH